MSVFHIEPIPYSPDAAERFAPFAESTGAIWLDSAQHQQGRFDVFTADPILRLTLLNRTFALSGPAATPEHQQCLPDGTADQAPTARQLFTLMDTLRVSLFGSTADNLQHSEALTPAQQQWLPGWLGLLSYSAGSVELSLKTREDTLTWPQASLGCYAWLAVLDHQAQCAWLITHSALLPLTGHTLETLRAQLHDSATAAHADTPTKTLPPLSPTGSVAQATPDTDYTAQFQQVKAYLTAGDCYQINLARRFQCQVDRPSFALYQRIRQHTKAPYSGFLKTEWGDCLCFSPEQFLTLTPQGELHTSPIKGTRPRDTNPEADQAIAQDLATSEKDRAENLMIVDLLRNDFGRICQANSIHVPHLMSVHSFATVHHLVSEVRGILRAGVSAEDTLAACFPGGSITGAPKKRAMQIIDELETHDRHAFCGSLCHLGANGSLNANICIRTGILQDQTFTLWAGGGIVIDSVLETEWIETVWKVQKILAACQQDAKKADP